MSDEEFLNHHKLRHWFVRTSDGWRLVVDGLPNRFWYFFGRTQEDALRGAREVITPIMVRARLAQS